MGKDWEKPGSVIHRAEAAAALAALTAVTVIGDVEGVRGLMQLIGLEKSRHALYAVTGSFLNPGPYGCLLGLSFVTAFALAGTFGLNMNATAKAASRLFGFGSMLVITAPLAASMSRTGWIAAMAGCAVSILLKRHTVRKRNNDAEQCRYGGQQILRWSVVTLATVALLGGLYTMKARSAQGRFLIWKCGMKAALHAPLKGVGDKHAIGAYGEAQEEYFRSGAGTEAEAMAAGAPEYFFNEYLHIAVAYGIPASAGFVALLAFSFTNALRAKAYGSAAGVTALAIVCLASYPFESILSVTTACCLVTGALAAPGFPGRWLTAVRWLLIVAAASVTWHVDSSLRSRDPNETQRLFEYGRSLQRGGHYEKSHAVLSKAMKQSSDCMIPTLMSKNADAMGDTAMARKLLEKVIWRCPARMYPRYLLMLHYGNLGDSVRMRVNTRRILDMPVKVHSTATTEMRQAATLVLMNQQPES